MMVAFARCCTPVQGDPILGYVTIGRGVSVHRADCVNAPDLMRKSERLVEVRWAGEPDAARQVELELTAYDRPNLMAEMLLAVARTTSQAGKPSNLSAAAASTLCDGMAAARFTVGIYDLEHLKRLMLNLYQVDGVTSVKRRDKRVKKRPPSTPSAGSGQDPVASLDDIPLGPRGLDPSDSA
jgi:GTP pyrophosphokinase